MDERTCPHCGQPIISWSVSCPGCNQVPWETAEGKRQKLIICSSRWLRGLIIVLAVGLLLAGLAAAIIKVQFNQTAKVRRHLDQMSSRVLYFEQSVRLSQDQEDTQTADIEKETRAWLDVEIPMLLNILQDYGEYSDIRIRALTLLVALFHRDSIMREWAPETHAQVVAALEALIDSKRTSDEMRGLLKAVNQSLRIQFD